MLFIKSTLNSTQSSTQKKVITSCPKLFKIRNNPVHTYSHVFRDFPTQTSKCRGFQLSSLFHFLRLLKNQKIIQRDREEKLTVFLFLFWRRKCKVGIAEGRRLRNGQGWTGKEWKEKKMFFFYETEIFFCIPYPYYAFL